MRFRHMEWGRGGAPSRLVWWKSQAGVCHCLSVDATITVPLVTLSVFLFSLLSKSEQSSAELSRAFCSLRAGRGCPHRRGVACKGYTEAELTSTGHPVTGRQEGAKTGKKGHKVTGRQGRIDSWADMYELEDK